jgi:hypothetical protein
MSAKTQRSGVSEKANAGEAGVMPKLKLNTPMNPLAKFRWFPTSSPRRLNWHFVKRV